MRSRMFAALSLLLPALLPAQGARDTVDIVIAATTDTHGWLRGWDYFTNAADTTRGLSRIATIVDSLRAANPERVVLVDAGDLLQGTPMTSIALRNQDRPNPIIAAMNVMRYDASVIGNHEFNYGLEYLSGSIRQASFPFLAANAFTPSGTSAYPASVRLTRGGVPIAIIGASTPGSIIWDRDKLRGRVEMKDIVSSVRDAVRDARARGAQLVIVLLHSGLSEPASYDTATTGLPSENVSARVAREVPGVDVIVFGHTHKELPDTTIGTTLLTQPRNWAGSVSVARVRLAGTGGGWSVVSRGSRVIRARGHAEHPGVLAATDDAHRRTVDYVTAPIGNTPVAWRSDSARVLDAPIIDFILEVERRAAKTDLASVAAFNLNAQFGPGPITIADMAALYPYENNVLRAVRITGKQLRDYLEFSARYFRSGGNRDSLVDPGIPGFNYDIVAGVDYVVDISKPIGARITSLMRNAKAVVDADTFTMALHDYRQQGGGGFAMIQGAPVVYDQQQAIRQLLIDEVQRRGTLKPEDYFTANWRLAPDSMVGAVYRSMRRLPFDREGAPRRAPVPPLTGPRLRIISTNDIHGYLEPWQDRQGNRRGGGAALVAAIRKARADCALPDCVSLLVDAGDMMQGPALSALVYGRPSIDVMNAIGYDAAAVGNHEFDWGADTLHARIRQARFPILSANVRTLAGKPVPWIRSDTLLVRGPYKIGVIGLTTTSAGLRSRAGADGFRFPDPRPLVDSLSRALRARGADAVIVVDHAGASCDRDGATNCRGEIIDLARDISQSVDAVIAGDSHSLIDTDVNGVPVVQARSHMEAITVVDLPLKERGGRPARHEVRPIYTDSLTPDAAIAAMVERAAAAVAARTSVRIGALRDSLTRRGDEYALGRLVADAQRVEGKADVAIMNNGGIRRDLPPGELTYGTLFELLPFANRLHRITVTGASLRNYLERLVAKDRPGIQLSGITVSYDKTRADGSRITDLTLTGGKKLRDAARYTVILNEFMSTGGDSFDFGDATLRDEPLKLTDLDALVRYLRKQKQPIVAPTDQRLVPAGAR